MSELTKFNAKIKFESGQGNKFEDNYSSTKNDGVPALIATIEKLAFIARVAGVSDEAQQAFNNEIKGA